MGKQPKSLSASQFMRGGGRVEVLQVLQRL